MPHTNFDTLRTVFDTKLKRFYDWLFELKMLEIVTRTFHPTHITIYSFWGTMLKVLQIVGISYILTVKNNDNWTFLIFVVFIIVIPLKLEARLYYLSITITTDTSPAHMRCSKSKWIL